MAVNLLVNIRYRTPSYEPSTPKTDCPVFLRRRLRYPSSAIHFVIIIAPTIVRARPHRGEQDYRYSYHGPQSEHSYEYQNADAC